MKYSATPSAGWVLRIAYFAPAFTLVEMMVVLGIIAILLSLVLLVGRSSLDDAKVKDTRVMIAQLESAIQTFANENPNKNIKLARQRWGAYPPDCIMAYVNNSNYWPIAPNRLPSLLPGGLGSYVKDSEDSRDLTDNYTASAALFIANSDTKALVWALRSDEKSRVIVDAIPDRFRRTVPINTPGYEFFDIDGDDAASGGAPELANDVEVQFMVDSWGNSLQYYSVFPTTGYVFEPSPSPHSLVSRDLVRINKGLPILMSYGPDGELQRSGSNRTFDELYNNGAAGTTVFADVLNEDNIYNDAALKDKVKAFTKP